MSDLVSLYYERINQEEPYAYQNRIIRDPSSKIVAVMGRRTGKDTIIAERVARLSGDIVVLCTNSIMAEHTFRMISESFSQSRIRSIRSGHKEIAKVDGTIRVVHNSSHVPPYVQDYLIINEPDYFNRDDIDGVLLRGHSVMLIGSPTSITGNLYHYRQQSGWTIYNVRADEALSPEAIETMRESMSAEQFRLEANM